MTRIKGKQGLKGRSDIRKVNLNFPEKFIEALEEKYDADSLQALFYALGLYGLGKIDLKKMTVVDVEDYLKEFEE